MLPSLAGTFRAMARNNAWCNHRLLNAVARLDQAAFEAHRTGFFPSLRRTLNHILVIDRFYVDALEGGSLGPAAWADQEPCATVAALQAAFDAEVQVLDYHEHAIGSGAKARAACYIELRVGARRLHGVGIDADIVAASFKALLCGMARAQALQAAVACSPMAD